MALKPPPIQDIVLNEDGFLKDTFVKWFQSITRESEDGFTGTYLINSGETVTVLNGKITDVS